MVGAASRNSVARPSVASFDQLASTTPGAAVEDAVAATNANTVAKFLFTSGSTGLPKGVMLTHYNLTSNIRQSIATGLAREDSVLLAFLPFFHIYGATLLLNAPLAVGALGGPEAEPLYL